MKRIRLSGKYAVGAHQFALVDDEDFEHLNQWAWKAKPNGGGNNVYAVRNVKVDGKLKTVRMHRVVLSAESDQMDVDHINHNSLDNRRSNLRLVSRSANVLNQRQVTPNGHCSHCGEAFKHEVPVGVMASVRYCSSSCKGAASRKRKSDRERPVRHLCCEQCKQAFETRHKTKRFCSKKCIDASAWVRRRKKVLS